MLALVLPAKFGVVRVETPNDPKLSDRRGWRDSCAAGSAGSSGRDSRAGSLQRMVRRCGSYEYAEQKARNLR